MTDGPLEGQQGQAAVTEPRDSDVLCGRGGAALRHPGNQTYRRLVNLNKGLYITCLKTEKLKISRSIVAAIREQNGRFLEKDAKKGSWYDIGDKKAIEKTSQALREGQPKLRQKLVDLNGTDPTLMGQQFGSLYPEQQMPPTGAMDGSGNNSMLPPSGNMHSSSSLSRQQDMQGMHPPSLRQDLHLELLERLSLRDLSISDSQQYMEDSQHLSDSYQRRSRLFPGLSQRDSAPRQLGVPGSQFSLMSDFSAYGGGGGSGQIPMADVGSLMSMESSYRRMLNSMAPPSMQPGSSSHFSMDVASANFAAAAAATAHQSELNHQNSNSHNLSHNNNNNNRYGSSDRDNIYQGGKNQGLNQLNNTDVSSANFAAAAAARVHQSEVNRQNGNSHNLSHNNNCYGNSDRDNNYLGGNIQGLNQLNNAGVASANFAATAAATVHQSELNHQNSNSHNMSRINSSHGDNEHDINYHGGDNYSGSNQGRNQVNNNQEITGSNSNNNNNVHAAVLNQGGSGVRLAGLDRRKFFARMKYNRPPSSTTMKAERSGQTPTNMASQRSMTDGMPDIHMVESSLSLYSNLSNVTGHDAKPSAVDLQGSSDKQYPQMETAKIVDHSRVAGAYPDALTSGSKHSIMSGLSRISDASVDHSIFSDLSKKIGNVSTRSIAMSEISAIDMQERENEDESSNSAFEYPSTEGLTVHTEQRKPQAAYEYDV